MSKYYNKRPSEIVGIDDTYTAYCLDEACLYISKRLKNGETPKFKKNYSSFTDLYKSLKL